MKIDYLGASSAFLLAMEDGVRILIDPGTTISDDARASLLDESVDLCLVTHSHGDHFDLDLAGRLKCKVIGPGDVIAQAAGVGLDTAVLTSGESLTIGAFTINAFPVSHGEVPTPVENLGYVVKGQGRTVAHLGDIRELAGSELPADELDVVFVPVGGSKVATPAVALSILTNDLRLAENAVVVPMHSHRTVELFEEFASLGAESGLKVCVPHLGQPLVVA